MSIVVSQQLGDVGHAKGKPIPFSWRWRYSHPELPLLFCLLLAMFVPRENRRPAAWLILVLPVLAGGLRALVPTLSSDGDAALYMAASLATAWAIVWLLTPWLCQWNRRRNAAAIVTAMLALGGVAYVGYFGCWFSAGTAGSLLWTWAVCSAALPAALAFSGACCRQPLRPAVVAAWLLLWLPISTLVFVGMLFGAMMLAVQPEISMLLIVVMSTLFVSVFLSSILYLVNLPAVLLAQFNGVYRGRMQAMIAPQQAEIPLETGNPGGEAGARGVS